MLEQIAHAAGLAQVAAVFVEGQAQFGGAAVAVVGEGLNQDGDAAGAVALVAHRLELVAGAASLARALGDRPLNVAARHGGCLGLFDRRAQLEIGRRIATAPGRHRDFPAQPGEEGAPFGIDHRLAAFDLGPFAVAGHGSGGWERTGLGVDWAGVGTGP